MREREREKERDRERQVGMVIHFNLVEVSIEKELYPLKWSNAKNWKEPKWPNMSFCVNG